jgi:hypothetical protein
MEEVCTSLMEEYAAWITVSLGLKFQYDLQDEIFLKHNSADLEKEATNRLISSRKGEGV